MNIQLTAVNPDITDLYTDIENVRWVVAINGNEIGVPGTYKDLRGVLTAVRSLGIEFNDLAEYIAKNKA